MGGGLRIILLHGTQWPFLRLNRWFEEGAPLQIALRRAFPGAAIEIFSWSGWNTQRARHAAALELIANLELWKLQSSKIVIIAHSHGGNVALQAAQKMRDEKISLITLGTPFLELRSEESVRRIGMLIVIMFSIPLFMTASLSSYFILFSTGLSATTYAGFSMVSFMGFGFLFYLVLVKLELYERLSTFLRNQEVFIRASFDNLSREHPTKMHAIWYELDEVLWATTVMRSISNNLRRRSKRSWPIINSVFRWWHPLFVGLALFGLALVHALNLYYFQLLWLMYLMIVILVVGIFAGAYALALIIPSFAAFYTNEVVKFKIAGASIGTFSPLENILISCRTGAVPVGSKPLQPDEIEVIPVPASQALRRNYHSYICCDPTVVGRIVRWIASDIHV